MIIKRVIIILCVIAFALIFIVAGYQIVQIYTEDQSAEFSYTDLEKFVTFPDPAPQRSPAEGETSVESESGEKGESILPEVDFDALKSINPDIVGWIYSEGTGINYPIVQAEDNSYYLKHLFDGEINSAGCIFLDCRNSGDFSDLHSVIYGHHMNSGAMFSSLLEYKEQSYYEVHPQFLLMTPEKNYVIEIFAGYVANVKDPAWEVAFSSEEEKAGWIEESIDKSWIQTGITPAASDQIVTLSTCSYEFSNARFVLLGILEEQG